MRLRELQTPVLVAGGIIAQPMAVEPDLSDTRGLKRSLDVADMEIAEVCSFISDVNVNEFMDEEEWPALSAELARLNEFEAKKDIPQDQATGPLLPSKRVRTVKNGVPDCRLCLRPFGGQSERSKESLYCPTPGATDLQNAAFFWRHTTVGASNSLTSEGHSHTHQSKILCLWCHLKSITVRFLEVSGK